MSLNYLATRFTCSWPWSTMIMLCDGRMVCGCADPYGKRVLGDARAETVSAIWTGPRASTLRQDINAGGSKFCGDCPLKLPLAKSDAPPQRGTDVGTLPTRLYIECTAACNISCAQACCAPETGITRTRTAGMLDFDLFQRVVDEAGPSLGRIDFFNYGEAFLHKRAIEMCEYIKSRFPAVYLYTSTNGLAFSEDQARRLIRSGIDEVTFSIDGATPETYAQYRRRGDFDKAIRNLRAAADEKARTGRDVPFINWRYILFTHNDSDQEMALARATAQEIGVDRLCWELTDHPENMFSRRFVPGSDALLAIKHEVWDDNNLGNAIPGATPRAEIAVRGAAGPLPLVARRGRQLTVKTTVRNASTRAFPAQASYGRRLVRLGAQLCSADGSILNRDFERAWLPEALQPGAAAQVPMTITAPAEPGRYGLKFDLVSEGIDWFEACGSPTTTKTLLVV
ncbi:MAG: radical SAM protein [Acidobacteria bacterium]|nr:radical SAM protein [Acidobacteriota bacterium]MCA1651776.1 radical SAM protein [Acidobacteriota bacterium]